MVDQLGDTRYRCADVLGQHAIVAPTVGFMSDSLSSSRASLVPQDMMAAPAPKETKVLGRALSLRSRLGSVCHRCADVRSFVEESPFIKIHPSSARHTGCDRSKWDRGFRLRIIAAPPSWFSATSLPQLKEFCCRVSVHQETAIAETSPFHTTCPTRHAVLPAL